MIPVEFIWAIHSVCLLACAVGMVKREFRMIWTAAIIYLNWFATISFNAATGSYTPAAWFIVIDALAFTMIIWRPASKAQAIIALPYLGSIALHFVSLAMAFDQHRYWEALLWLSYAQLGMLFGWGTAGGGKLVRDLLRRRRPDVPLVAVARNLDDQR